MKTPWMPILLAVALAALAGPPVLAGDDVTVSQRNRHFSPDSLHLTRGETVHIVNDDNVTHHVFIDSPKMKFDSGEQPVGTTTDLHFDEAGNFTVRCAIHPTMKLAVTVE
jgi:plastocyanin